jgi:uncharacterized iron-regulated membrane protein
MNDQGISIIIGVISGVYIWWKMTHASWTKQEPFFDIMKALAMTFFMAPMCGMIGSMLVTFIASKLLN